MSDFNFKQIPFAVEFAENPEPRCPCILLLDTSYSMQGEGIKELKTQDIQRRIIIRLYGDEKSRTGYSDNWTS
ncbi:hypothetical protein [Paenibacillus sonchi]|uniref:hypothetical protein n=1 Tax=Paenibacillus sonchi TaxID=373687 RepID=UPI000685F677|nr:hypothetical protein [Paenibacillus sonchi]MCE3202317.1 hypothetical protein [Paenibacillus sonchi]